MALPRGYTVEQTIQEIDAEIRMEAIRQSSSKIEFRELHGAVKRNLMDKKMAYDAETRKQIIESIQYMQRKISAEKGSSLQKKLQNLANNFEGHYIKRDHGVEISAKDFHILLSGDDDKVFHASIGFFGQETKKSNTLAQRMNEEDWSSLRIDIDRMIRTVPLDAPSDVKAKLAQYRRGLDSRLKDSMGRKKEVTFSAINDLSYGYLVDGSSLSPLKIILYSDPSFAIGKAPRQLFDWSLDQDIPYATLVIVEHHRTLVFPTPDDIEFNYKAALVMRFSTPWLLSQEAIFQLEKLSAYPREIKEKVNLLRLISDVHCKSSDFALTGRTMGMDFRYRMPASYLDDENDVIIDELLIEDHLQLATIIQVLRQQAVFNSSWESTVASSLNSRKEPAPWIEVQLGPACNEWETYFTAKYPDGIDGHFKVKMESASQNGNDCNDGTTKWKVSIMDTFSKKRLPSEPATEFFNNTWSLPMTLARIVTDLGLSGRSPFETSAPRDVLLPSTDLPSKIDCHSENDETKVATSWHRRPRRGHSPITKDGIVKTKRARCALLRMQRELAPRDELLLPVPASKRPLPPPMGGGPRATRLESGQTLAREAMSEMNAFLRGDAQVNVKQEPMMGSGTENGASMPQHQQPYVHPIQQPMPGSQTPHQTAIGGSPYQGMPPGMYGRGMPVVSPLARMNQQGMMMQQAGMPPFSPQQQALFAQQQQQQQQAMMMQAAQQQAAAQAAQGQHQFMRQASTSSLGDVFAFAGDDGGSVGGGSPGGSSGGFSPAYAAAGAFTPQYAYGQGGVQSPLVRGASKPRRPRGRKAGNVGDRTPGSSIDSMNSPLGGLGSPEGKKRGGPGSRGGRGRGRKGVGGGSGVGSTPGGSAAGTPTHAPFMRSYSELSNPMSVAAASPALSSAHTPAYSQSFDYGGGEEESDDDECDPPPRPPNLPPASSAPAPAPPPGAPPPMHHPGYPPHGYGAGGGMPPMAGMVPPPGYPEGMSGAPSTMQQQYMMQQMRQQHQAAIASGIQPQQVGAPTTLNEALQQQSHTVSASSSLSRMLMPGGKPVPQSPQQPIKQEYPPPPHFPGQQSFAPHPSQPPRAQLPKNPASDLFDNGLENDDDDFPDLGIEYSKPSHEPSPVVSVPQPTTTNTSLMPSEGGVPTSTSLSIATSSTSAGGAGPSQSSGGSKGDKKEKEDPDGKIVLKIKKSSSKDKEREKKAKEKERDKERPDKAERKESKSEKAPSMERKVSTASLQSASAATDKKGDRKRKAEGGGEKEAKKSKTKPVEKPLIGADPVFHAVNALKPFKIPKKKEEQPAEAAGPSAPAPGPPTLVSPTQKGAPQPPFGAGPLPFRGGPPPHRSGHPHGGPPRRDHERGRGPKGILKGPPGGPRGPFPGERPSDRGIDPRMRAPPFNPGPGAPPPPPPSNPTSAERMRHLSGGGSSLPPPWQQPGIPGGSGGPPAPAPLSSVPRPPPPQAAPLPWRGERTSMEGFPRDPPVYQPPPPPPLSSGPPKVIPTAQVVQESPASPDDPGLSIADE